MKTLALALVLLCTSMLYGSSEIELRITPEHHDVQNHFVYAAVEIAVSNDTEVVLADQNYRLYYDSELLSLDRAESFSDLPMDKYSDLEVLELFEGIKANHVKQLAFDQSLGFVNFKIDLLDNSNGGIALHKGDGWQKVAVLKFEIKNDEVPAQMVWSRPQVTDQYATAFVELMEWVSPNQTAPLEVKKYADAVVKKEEITAPIYINVGPNPTLDFVKIEYSETMQASTLVRISDTNGRILVNKTMPSGTQKTTLNISSLPASIYTVEIVDMHSEMSIHSVKIAKVDY